MGSRALVLDHLHLVVFDVQASRRFYNAVAHALGGSLQHHDSEAFSSGPLYVSSYNSGQAQGRLTGRQHIAFRADSQDAVRAFHAAALAAGGCDNGEPGFRSYSTSYFAAFVLDPDGNNIESVHRDD